MRRILLILSVFIFAFSSMNANTHFGYGTKGAYAAGESSNSIVKYLGEVYVGESFCIVDAESRFNIHTVHGVKIGDYFSAGIGTGVDIYHEDDLEYSLMQIPLFVNVKGYLPVSPKVSLYASMDGGKTFGIGDSSGFTSWMYVPAVGVKIKFINIQFGYVLQRYTIKELDWRNIDGDALQLKVGFVF